MTAFAIFGSATSTSLASRGRSIIVDLPMPSERKRVFTGMPDVVSGAGSIGAESILAALVFAGSLLTASLSVADETPGITATAAAENASALINRLRIDVWLPLAMFFVLLVKGVVPITSPRWCLDLSRRSERR